MISHGEKHIVPAVGKAMAAYHVVRVNCVRMKQAPVILALSKIEKTVPKIITRFNLS